METYLNVSYATASLNEKLSTSGANEFQSSYMVTNCLRFKKSVYNSMYIDTLSSNNKSSESTVLR